MRMLLAPFKIMYLVSSSISSWIYKLGIVKPIRLPQPVISVGNLTVGGTGKTPFVDALLSHFEGRGLHCCVLTRGYGRRSMETFTVIDAATTDQVGDEPLWLFRRHPQSKVIVSAQRALAGTAV